MAAQEFHQLPLEDQPQYEHVFNESYWWNPPQTPLHDLRDEIAGPNAGQPVRKFDSMAGAVVYGALLDREHVQLTKTIELPAGSIFRASDYIGTTLVHSLVEGIHRQPQIKPTTGQPERSYEYVHLESGFLIRRTDQTGRATYFQGNAWHIVVPDQGKNNPGNIVRSIIIDAEARDKIHLYKGDMRRPKSSLRQADVHSFSAQEYLAWVVGRVEANKPATARPSRASETWNHRFKSTSVYKVSRQHTGGDSHRRDPEKAKKKLAPRFGFTG